MSKLIKLTDEYCNEIRKEFNEVLSSAKLSDGKISYTKSLGNIERKAVLYFNELAYLKMLALVRKFDNEVAWHGLAKRGDDKSKDEYVIYDILVYPQEVTGSTVNTDQEKYQTWLMSHEDDVFNNIRMQGHSHVNMGTSPSSVDTSLYERILDQLDDSMFYIFLIWNKRGERTIKIYDLEKNVLFETSDVAVKILNDGTGIENFLNAVEKMVSDKKYSVNSNECKRYRNMYEDYGYEGSFGYWDSFDYDEKRSSSLPYDLGVTNTIEYMNSGKLKKKRKKKEW